VLSLVVSTVVFFALSYFLKRWADANDIPKGMTRNASIFAVALILAYGVAWVVDRLAA
jgi:hypothetical protein